MGTLVLRVIHFMANEITSQAGSSLQSTNDRPYSCERDSSAELPFTPQGPLASYADPLRQDSYTLQDSKPVQSLAVSGAKFAGKIGVSVGAGVAGTAAGALIGQALIPIPFVGAAVGAFVGGALFSGAAEVFNQKIIDQEESIHWGAVAASGVVGGAMSGVGVVAEQAAVQVGKGLVLTAAQKTAMVVTGKTAKTIAGKVATRLTTNAAMGATGSVIEAKVEGREVYAKDVVKSAAIAVAFGEGVHHAGMAVGRVARGVKWNGETPSPHKFNTDAISTGRKGEVSEWLGGREVQALTLSEQKTLILHLLENKGWKFNDVQQLIGIEGMKQFFGYGREIPFGFESVDQFRAFQSALMQRLAAEGVPVQDPRVQVVVQGSAVRGTDHSGRQPFRWEGNDLSDIDIAVILPKESFDSHVAEAKTRVAESPKDLRKLDKLLDSKSGGPRLNSYFLSPAMRRAHNALRDIFRPLLGGRNIQISLMPPESGFNPLNAGEIAGGAMILSGISM